MPPGLSSGDSSSSTSSATTTNGPDSAGEGDENVAPGQGPLSVWIAEDAVRIKKYQIESPLEQGQGNAIWSPSAPIQLRAIRDETVAFQVILEANDHALHAITVDLAELVDDNGHGIRNSTTTPTNYVGRWIESFVEHYVEIKRPSGGPWGSYGGTGAGAMLGWVPDALIPTEIAPTWAPYPIALVPGENAAIWFDITVPTNLAPGLYRGQVVVAVGGIPQKTISIELEVGAARMPVFPVHAAVYYEPSYIGRRVGWERQDLVERHVLQLLRRHRLQANHYVDSIGRLQTTLPALTGQLYTADQGYEGPGEGVGDSVVQLGQSGELDSVDTSLLDTISQLAEQLAARDDLAHLERHVVLRNGTDCHHEGATAWKRALQDSELPFVRDLLLRWRCDGVSADQEPDVIVVRANDYTIAQVTAAREAGKQVWLFDPQQPQTGSLLSDHMTTAPVINGWIQAHWQIDRFNHWDIAYWYDWANEPDPTKSAFDPFVRAETLHNRFDEYRQGGGILIYPGRQVDYFSEHSLGFDGVLASIRLKLWRRGIQDAGYYQLAKARNATTTTSVAEGLIRLALDQPASNAPPAWPAEARDFQQARQQLWQIIESAPPRHELLHSSR